MLYWNAQPPSKDKQFEKYYENPVLAAVLQKLYPQFGPFKSSGRSDLVAVLGTGLKTPALNYTGPTFADELRLNLAIPATPFSAQRPTGMPRRALPLAAGRSCARADAMISSACSYGISRPS